MRTNTLPIYNACPPPASYEKNKGLVNAIDTGISQEEILTIAEYEELLSNMLAIVDIWGNIEESESEAVRVPEKFTFKQSVKVEIREMSKNDWYDSEEDEEVN